MKWDEFHFFRKYTWVSKVERPECEYNSKSCQHKQEHHWGYVCFKRFARKFCHFFVIQIDRVYESEHLYWMVIGDLKSPCTTHQILPGFYCGGVRNSYRVERVFDKFSTVSQLICETIIRITLIMTVFLLSIFPIIRYT